MKTQISRLILLVLVAQRFNISWIRSFLRFHTVRPKKSSWSNWAQMTWTNQLWLTKRGWGSHGIDRASVPVPRDWRMVVCWAQTQGSSTPALLQLLVPRTLWGQSMRVLFKEQAPESKSTHGLLPEKILLLKIVSWTKECASDTLGHLLVQHVLPPREPAVQSADHPWVAVSSLQPVSDFIGLIPGQLRTQNLKSPGIQFSLCWVAEWPWANKYSEPQFPHLSWR